MRPQSPLSERERLLLYDFFSARPIKRAFLFGSFARKEARKNSDLDILVELDHTQSIGMKFFGFQLGLVELLKRKVHLVSADGFSKHIKPFVEKDKVLIYEKGTD